MARPKTALIVDDESHVRKFLRLVLKEIGIELAWEAANGAEALTLANQHHPELVLLDLNMPVVGGMDTLRQLQSMQPGLPVIVVTTQNAMRTVEDAARIGALGYILKQSPKDQIKESLLEALSLLEE